MRDTSVLEMEKLEAILRGLTKSEMKIVATGMATLGNACRSHAEGAKRRATAR